MDIIEKMGPLENKVIYRVSENERERERKNDMESDGDGERTTLIFTRYLYSKEDVFHSLFISVLDKNPEEALFWGYELYFSGFQHDVMEYVMRIFRELSFHVSPRFVRKINELYQQWMVDNNLHHILATMLWNLAINPFDISQFVLAYFEISLSNKQPIGSPSKLFIRFSDSDISKYKNLIHDLSSIPHRLFKTAAIYPAHKHISVLFLTTDIGFRQQYINNWLYHASFSPLWRERIQDFHGIIDHISQNVVFPDDDCFDNFYSLYGYDTEEQPLEVQRKSLGIGNETQMTIQDFIETYTLSL
jgi:hypothetical protein